MAHRQPCTLNGMLISSDLTHRWRTGALFLLHYRVLCLPRGSVWPHGASISWRSATPGVLLSPDPLVQGMVAPIASAVLLGSRPPPGSYPAHQALLGWVRLACVSWDGRLTQGRLSPRPGCPHGSAPVFPHPSTTPLPCFGPDPSCPCLEWARFKHWVLSRTLGTQRRTPKATPCSTDVPGSLAHALTSPSRPLLTPR